MTDSVTSSTFSKFSDTEVRNALMKCDVLALGKMKYQGLDIDFQLNLHFADAIMSGYLDSVMFLLNNSEAPITEYEDFFHHIANYSNFQCDLESVIVDEIISRAVSIDDAASFGLDFFTDRGDDHIVESIFGDYKDKILPSCLNECLCKAVTGESSDLVEFFIKNGADLNNESFEVMCIPAMT
ncbi:MAG: hypothetical protein HAW67_03290, partial [Endozoicomonadaceae bacterium]|nr:hypothetical protein [Endozoicomonadaceae bacterium]